MNTPLLVIVVLLMPMILSCIPPWEQSEWGHVVLFFEQIASLVPAIIPVVATISMLFNRFNINLSAIALLQFAWSLMQLIARFITFPENEYTGVFTMVGYGLLTLSVPGKLVFAVATILVIALALFVFRSSKRNSRHPGGFFGLQKILLSATYITLIFFGQSWYPQAVEVMLRLT